jgi:hypothetical protein
MSAKTEKQREISLPAGGSGVWTEYTQSFEFKLADFCLWRKTFNAKFLDTPFLHLTTDLNSSLPDWRSIPDRVQVAVVSGQPLSDDLPPIFKKEGSVGYVTINENRYFIEFEGTFEEYLKKFSAKERFNLQRQVRKFSEGSGGTINAKQYRRPSEIRSFIDMARAISQKTYQAAMGIGMPDSEDFLAKAVELAEQNRALGFILFMKEKPVAYSYFTVQKDTLVYSMIGYDPEYRKLSPGTTLLYLMLESFFSTREFRYMEFGGMETGYKRHFATGQIRCARIHYFRPTISNQIFVLSHHLSVRLSYSLGKVMDLIGIKDKLKRLMRRP